MTLPSSGSISAAQINAELGRPATQRISLSDPAVRALFARTSGTISMSHGRGKSSAPVVAPPTLSFRRETNYGYQSDLEYYVGGDGTVTSARWASGGSYMSISKRSNTIFRVTANRTYTGLQGVLQVTATNDGGSVSVNRTVNLYYDDGSQGCCFTGDSLVTMGDGGYKRIDEIVAGDWVKTPFGQAEVDWVRLPILDTRPLLAMDGGICKTSGEHGIWTRDEATGQQWWSTRDLVRWKFEQETNLGPGLNGQEPWDLTDDENGTATFATEDGWLTTGWSVVEDAAPDTQLYHLYLKDHASYFVDGVLVIGELPRVESLIDWTQFQWIPEAPQMPVYMEYDYELTPIVRDNFPFRLADTD